MHMCTAMAAGGTNQRLNPAFATVASRERKFLIKVPLVESGKERLIAVLDGDPIIPIGSPCLAYRFDESRGCTLGAQEGWVRRSSAFSMSHDAMNASKWACNP